MGTVIEEGKEKISVKGKDYLLETALTADVAIILAEKADEFGNLVYSKTARGYGKSCRCNNSGRKRNR